MLIINTVDVNISGINGTVQFIKLYEMIILFLKHAIMLHQMCIFGGIN